MREEREKTVPIDRTGRDANVDDEEEKREEVVETEWTKQGANLEETVIVEEKKRDEK